MQKILRVAINPMWALGLGVALVGASCGKSDRAAGPGVLKPKEAASHLQQAFTSAPQEIKQNATIASEALRSADYEKALQSLHSMTVRKDLTFDQGMAVQESMVALEARLIAEADAGNAKAKQTYELFRKSRRN